MSYNNNFNFYIEELMKHIYKQKLYKLAYQLELESLDNASSDDLNEVINSIINNNILPDLNTEEIIKDFINALPDSYFMRKAISIEKNYLYPNLYDNNGNPKTDHNYTKSLITLWKNDMDEFYVDEVYSRFNKKSFITFVKDNFNALLDDIVLYIKNKIESSKVVIECSSKDEVLDVIKGMILDKSLDFKWAEFLVDTDSLRNEMLTFAGNLSIYSEFDKLEDDTKYCLDNHCKYNSMELFDILTTEKGFIWTEGVGLVYK